MENIIKIDSFSKSYHKIQAVNSINLEIKKGEMFGLVGPDGAGKSTTIRTLCGLINPDSGNITMLGFDIKSSKREIQKEIGYLSQKFSLYGDLTIDENIEFFAEIHNIKDYKDRRNELLDFTRLTKFRDRLADQLSGGMKQKLALASALIHKPKIIFLDEPTTGVDPVSRRDFWKILSKLIQEGITIVMATPYLDEAERCHTVAMMNKGEIIAVDSPKEIKKLIKRDVIEIVCSPAKEAYSLLNNYKDYDAQLFGDRINIVVNNYENDMQYFEKLFRDSNIQIIDYRKITPSLENVFIHLITKAG